jgi:SAM-dependent methyltransferase
MTDNPAAASRETWLSIWRQTNFQELALWDDQCELVYSFFMSLLNTPLRNKRILETGSGTGRVSLRLAKEGANVLLLDISRDALTSSKNLFKTCYLKGDFVVADISHLPFTACAIDAVWSSGVLEHFSLEQMEHIICSSLEILKEDGKLIIIVPNKNAFVYNFSRLLDMKLGRWRWGYEEPLSAKDLCCFQSKPILRVQQVLLPN